MPPRRRARQAGTPPSQVRARATDDRRALALARARGVQAQGALAKLIEDGCRGGMTLVLGSGLTIPYEVPSWFRLVEDLWRTTFNQPMPKVAEIPQSLPMALDRIADRLGTARFISALRRRIYEGVRLPSELASPEQRTSLACVARLLVREYNRGERRRISRVITFNVDDLLERAVAQLCPDKPVLRPVARASHHPARGLGEQPIPVYHLHGFLPSTTEHRRSREAPDALIFTDAQYWTSAATPMSFANRTMAFALHDSRCVFIGTSMTDINMIRWLSVRAVEIESDVRNRFSLRSRVDERELRRAVRETLDRHYWIRTHQEDPTGFLGEYLELRGVRSVPVRSWDGADFGQVLNAAFPNGDPL